MTVARRKKTMFSGEFTFSNNHSRSNCLISFFSSDHFSYAAHDCPAAKNRDFQVPVCPMCLKPVPSTKGQEDYAVSEHIDKFCRTETKIYTNSCTFGKCKKRELIPFNCSSCQKNFCLKHRHFDVHNCQGRSQNASQREVLA